MAKVPGTYKSNAPTPPRTVMLQHSIVGRDELTNFEFDPDKPFRCCLLCGDVYQTDADRAIMPNSPPLVIYNAPQRRQMWAELHNRQKHTDAEHRNLKLSGLMCTPEAAEKLAPYGIVPVSDIVLSDEHEHAAKQAPRAPVNDAIHDVRKE